MTTQNTGSASEPSALPPYSGEHTVCPKCFHAGARTRHRAAGEHSSRDRHTLRPSTKGERLERECWRCDYSWDEALATGPDNEDAVPLADLTSLLMWAHARWTAGMPPHHAEQVAAELLKATVVLPRPDHPFWQPTPERNTPCDAPS